GGHAHHVDRGARHHRGLRPRREQLRPQARRVRGVRRGGPGSRALLAADQPVRPDEKRRLVMNAVRLLLVEDSEDDAVHVVARLRAAGIELTWQRVETGETMAAALRDRRPDVIVSGNGIPRFTAADALRLLRGTGLDVPFIVVSGRIGEESAAALMRAGAQDF